MRGVPCISEPTGNSNLQSLSALLSLLVSLSSLLWYWFWFTVTALMHVAFSCSRQLYSAKSSLKKPSVHCTLHALHQSIVEHLAAKRCSPFRRNLVARVNVDNTVLLTADMLRMRILSASSYQKLDNWNIVHHLFLSVSIKHQLCKHTVHLSSALHLMQQLDPRCCDGHRSVKM